MPEWSQILTWLAGVAVSLTCGILARQLQKYREEMVTERAERQNVLLELKIAVGRFQKLEDFANSPLQRLAEEQEQKVEDIFGTIRRIGATIMRVARAVSEIQTRIGGEWQHPINPPPGVVDDG